MSHVKAHIKHPTRDGESMCGAKPLHVRPCGECVEKYAAQARVHIRSVKKPGLAQCGEALLIEEGEQRPKSRGGFPAPAYVDGPQAREWLADQRAEHVCPACQTNFGRAERAAGRVTPGDGPFGRVTEPSWARPSAGAGSPAEDATQARPGRGLPAQSSPAPADGEDDDY